MNEHLASQAQRPYRGSHGFTLIEVMIVVAIIGILAAIAYPAYGKFVREARRSDAHLSLLAASQAMERCRSTSFSYLGCAVPATSSEDHYTLALSTQTANTFTLTATAKGIQAVDTDCATITIDHLGERGPASGTAADEPSVCWD